MQARRVFRIVASLAILAILWVRAIQDRWAGSWLAGSVALTVVLLLTIGMELWQSVRGHRRPADAVPKRPLGLGS